MATKPSFTQITTPVVTKDDLAKWRTAMREAVEHYNNPQEDEDDDDLSPT